MRTLLSILLSLIPLSAAAELASTASHVVWRSDAEHLLPIGGDSQHVLAQTFESRHSAPLSHVTLILGCSDLGSGEVTVEIRSTDSGGAPAATVLVAASLDWSELYPLFPSGAHDFHFTGLSLVAGEQYAIVVRGDETLDCAMPEGGWLIAGIGYDDGESWSAFESDPSAWTPLDFGGGDDLAFWAYVDLPDIVAPRYCDIANFSGIPENWLSNDLPACSCVSDSATQSHRCWFSFPGWVAWREMTSPFVRPTGVAEWSVAPMSSDFPGMSITESNLDGSRFASRAEFSPGLRAGSVHRVRVRYRGQPTGTLVDFEFEIDGEAARVQFETLVDIPKN